MGKHIEFTIELHSMTIRAFAGVGDSDSGGGSDDGYTSTPQVQAGYEDGYRIATEDDIRALENFMAL